MDELKVPQRELLRISLPNPQRNIMNLTFMVVATTSFTPLRYFSDDCNAAAWFLKIFFFADTRG